MELIKRGYKEFLDGALGEHPLLRDPRGQTVAKDKSNYPTERYCLECDNSNGFDLDGWHKCDMVDVRGSGYPSHCDMFKKKSVRFIRDEL